MALKQSYDRLLSREATMMNGGKLSSEYNANNYYKTKMTIIIRQRNPSRGVFMQACHDFMIRLHAWRGLLTWFNVNLYLDK